MANIVVYKREDGGIDIIHPTIRKPNNVDDITFLGNLSEKTYPTRKYTIVSDEFIKKIGFKLFSEFRNALTLKEQGIPKRTVIEFDLEKCKLIWVEKIRQHRNNQLKDLDIEFMKAMEDGDSDAVKEIGDLKKILRDLPQDFMKMKFTNIYQLKRCWPDILQPVPPFVLK